MKCDELKKQKYCQKLAFGDEVYLAKQVDAAIDELKDKIQMHDFFWEGCGFAKRGFKNTIAVSEAFDRLEAENAELKKKLMPCLNGDCILTCEVVEKYGKENAELKQKLDKAIAERDGNQVCIDALKDEIKRKEGVGQRWFERCMEARTENVSLKRALWIARAERAKEAFLKWNLFPNFETTNKLFTIDEYDETPGATDGQVLRTCEGWAMIWQNVERKCRAKVEEYK